MKNSERNLNVINNFIDHWTSDDSERERMYKVASGYIEEDHVDGRGNDKDPIVIFGTMKTIVSEITGRKDFPVYQDMTDEEIFNHLKRTDWAEFETKVFEDEGIAVFYEEGEEYFKIINVELVKIS